MASAQSPDWSADWTAAVQGHEAEERLLEAVRHAARQGLGSRPDEDTTGWAVAKVLELLREGKPAPDNLQSYVRKMAQRKQRDVRKKKAPTPVADLDHSTETMDPVRAAANSELRAAFAACLEELPEKPRLLHLMHVEGIRPEHLHDRFGAPLVRWLLDRAPDDTATREQLMGALRQRQFATNGFLRSALEKRGFAVS